MEKRTWICEYCGFELQSKTAWYKHKKDVHLIKNGQQKKIDCYCTFCNRAFNRLASKSFHEKYCIKNPNAVKCIGHSVSEATKKKISEGMIIAHKEGRANEWSGRRERSYAEQSWYNIFTNDFGKGTFLNNYFVKNIGLILLGQIKKFILK